MKRLRLIALVCVINLLLSGCAPLVQIVDVAYGEKLAKEEASVIHIGFSNGEMLKEEMQTLLTEDELLTTENQYTIYRGTTAYDTLMPNEQLVYLAMEYAMEHQYTNILVDGTLVDSPEMFGKILTYLSLDSPLLEQNLRYHVGTFQTSYPINVLDLYKRQVKFEGYYITVDNFAKEYWDKKMIALEKAREIVDNLASDLTDAQKARQLYQYVAENVQYTNYSDLQEVQPFLYDALIEEKTHCDGFSNALALLLRLAGIENIEKFYNAKDGGVGHTWNFCRLDGKWYNMDATGAKSILSDATSIGMQLYYAYPDELQSYQPDYKELYESSDKGLDVNVDLYIEDIADAAQKIVTQYKAKSGCLLLADECDETALQNTMQNVANNLQKSIYWTKYSVINDKTAVYIY